MSPDLRCSVCHAGDGTGSLEEGGIELRSSKSHANVLIIESFFGIILHLSSLPEQWWHHCLISLHKDIRDDEQLQPFTEKWTVKYLGWLVIEDAEDGGPRFCINTLRRAQALVSSSLNWKDSWGRTKAKGWWKRNENCSGTLAVFIWNTEKVFWNANGSVKTSRWKAVTFRVA